MAGEVGEVNADRQGLDQLAPDLDELTRIVGRLREAVVEEEPDVEHGFGQAQRRRGAGFGHPADGVERDQSIADDHLGQLRFGGLGIELRENGGLVGRVGMKTERHGVESESRRQAHISP